MKLKIALLSILANMVLAVGKVIIGYISNSASVLADGIHSLTDVFSSFIGYIGIKVSQKPKDLEHPYGHFKFEVLATFFITLILFGTGVGIIYESYQNFLNPSLIKIPILAFGIMAFSALVNEIMARFKISIGKKENSMALFSDGVHSRVDVFASLTVFIGLFLTKYWIYTDSILAFLIGIYIIKESISLGKEATDSLLDASAGPEIEEKIKSIIQNENIKINSLKTQKKGSVITVDFEIDLPSTLNIEEATSVSEDLRKKLMNEIKNLFYVVIQIKSHKMESGFYKPAFGRGYKWQRRGKFKEEIEKAEGMGPEGFCICPKCGYEIKHQVGVPCASIQCPHCKINLERKKYAKTETL